jgi:F-type H+-transporting ATPase subunit delta
MQGVSRDSLAAARDALDTLVRAGDTDLVAVGEQLSGVVPVLDREIALRRALTDPARSGDDRAALARAVFGARLSGAAEDLFVWEVRARWSAARDLADAVELLAVEAVVAAADKAGRLDRVEEELFRVGRTVDGSPDLRSALADLSAPIDARAALLDSLLAGRVSDETQLLVRQAVRQSRGRTFDRTVDVYAEVAAERRSRMVALVTAAVPLTEQQRDRLASALSRIYGHDVHLNIEIDSDLVGGVRVEIGDEVIDGAVSTRLDEARRQLTR